VLKYDSAGDVGVVGVMGVVGTDESMLGGLVCRSLRGRAEPRNTNTRTSCVVLDICDCVFCLAAWLGKLLPG
jgi:hypothetical protein